MQKICVYLLLCMHCLCLLVSRLSHDPVMTCEMMSNNKTGDGNGYYEQGESGGFSVEGSKSFHICQLQDYN